jgi:tripartite-type tricarboxylate transporter receptor subunit TctC
VADASARFFAEAWTAQTRQQVVIDNRPGGNYQIGMQQLLQAPPDGHTWIHMATR